MRLTGMTPTHVSFSRRARCSVAHGMAVLALACAGAAQAAAPLPGAVQAELDAAVLAHASGRHAEAARAFDGLARRGVPAAHYNLAVMHLHGELPNAHVDLARRHLETAAQGGFVTAQLMLARALETAQFGGRPRLADAVAWYRRAAEAGSPEAQLELGTALYLGRGTARDAASAAHWFREAAKAGDVGAMYLLASMYEQGDGVESDLRLARYWYATAAGLGDEAAPGKVRELDARVAAPAPAPAAPATARP
jgi:TPR repeat protein